MSGVHRASACSSRTAGAAPHASLRHSARGICPGPLHQRCPLLAPPRSISGDAEERTAGAAPPIFNDAFRAVLADSLSRQSRPDMLFDEGFGSGSEEPRRSNQEELLINAVNSCRQSLRAQLAAQEALKSTIERERRQLDRLQTALKLVETDAAYYRVLDGMMKDRK